MPYYIHFCKKFNENIAGYTNQEDNIKNRLEQIKKRNTLKGASGSLDAYPGGIAVLNILGALTCRTIIQEKEITIESETIKVLFIREFIPKSGLDYFWPKIKKSISNKLWLEQNPLSPEDEQTFIIDYKEKHLNRSFEKLPELPELYANWPVSFQLDIKFDIYEEEEWVNYTFNPSERDGLNEKDIELFRIMIYSVSHGVNTHNLTIKEENKEANLFSCIHNESNVGILYIKPKVLRNDIFIICDGAHTVIQQNRWTKALEINRNRPDKYKSFEDIGLETLRAYSKSALKDRDLWYAILQKNGQKSNFSLMPEQVAFLREFSFPSYINGQAGSGKSTMLCYIFAYAFLNQYINELPGDILFITENENLLNSTKSNVRDLLRYNNEFAGIEPEEIIKIDNQFISFKDLLINQSSKNPKFNHKNYLSFRVFKEKYEKSNIPSSIKSKLSAETCWLAISTYIYGYHEDIIIDNIDKYEEIPSKFRVLDNIIFSEICKNILPFYNQLIENGYWDKLTLIKYLYESSEVSKGNYSLIVCDEAQDFSRVELRFILNLSKYTLYDPSNYAHAQFPVVFAGDALQTVNPTGFRMDRLRDLFYNELTGLGYNENVKIFIPRYNYRSAEPIVNLANAIQEFRITVLSAEKVEAQRAKRKKHIGKNSYMFFSTSWLDKFENKDTFKSIFEHKVFIIPVDINGEEDYKQKNLLIKTFLNVKSSVDAKGVEYPQVVVYGFGDYYNSKFGPLTWREPSTTTLFENQFFFNKLYVAVTRAQNEIIFIDTEKGIEEFWKPLVAQFKTIEENCIWNANSFSNVIESTKEDSKYNAERDKEQGLIDKNSSRLKIASDVFYNIGDNIQYYECRAWSEKFNGNLIKAADYFEKSLNYKEQANCLWEIKKWENFRMAASKLSGDQIEAQILIARFMESENGVWDKTEVNKAFFLRDKFYHILKDIDWRDEFIYNLITFSQNEEYSIFKRDLVYILESIALEHESNVWDFVGLLYYQLRQFHKAVETWDKIKELNHKQEANYYRASIEIAQQGDNYEKQIIFMGRLQEHTELTKEEKIRISKEIITLFNDKIEKNKMDDTYRYMLLHVLKAYFIRNEKQSILEIAALLELSNDILADKVDTYEYLIINTDDPILKSFAEERYLKNRLYLEESQSTNKINYEKFIFEINSKMTELNLSSNWSLEEIRELPTIPIFKKPGLHFTNFKVQNFKKFSNLEIKNIGQFNLILGDNNVGKTSLLEALTFATEPDLMFSRLFYIDMQRKNSNSLDIENSILSNFFNDPEKQEIIFRLGEKRRNLEYLLTFPTLETLGKFYSQPNPNPNNYIILKLQQEVLNSNHFSQPASIIFPRVSSSSNSFISPSFIPFGKGYASDLANIYFSIIESSPENEEKLISSLENLIPEIKRIITDPKSDEIFIIEKVEQSKMRPLYSYGEGANKLFRIILEIFQNRDGRVMIDEIDAGIHFCRFENFWNIILKTARDLNVQIFATTHNIECISYFAQIIEKNNEFQQHSRVITLENMGNNKIIAYSRQYEEFGHAIEFGLNLRGGKK
ncbi:MAG TPA: AAA family ATPase [Saprospiraceae bacterium]|nr:AAA family ATPase [Saprospiraceae bacterium]